MVVHGDVPITSSPTINGQINADWSWMSTVGHTCGGELHRRQPVDEWPAMPRDPSAQAVGFRDRHILEQFGMQTGREPAAQVLVRTPDEERTRGEGHKWTELRTDQRHHFGETRASSHRLGDLIQRVVFTVGEAISANASASDRSAA